MDDSCEDHSTKFAGLKHMDHPDHSKADGKHLHGDHERAAAHPAHHSKGMMPSQLNPEHGPHHQHKSQR